PHQMHCSITTLKALGAPIEEPPHSIANTTRTGWSGAPRPSTCSTAGTHRPTGRPARSAAQYRGGRVAAQLPGRQREGDEKARRHRAARDGRGGSGLGCEALPDGGWLVAAPVALRVVEAPPNAHAPRRPAASPVTGRGAAVNSKD